MGESQQEHAFVGVTVAGKYRIERVIGSGAMGVVCAARHLELGKRVALKVIESSIAGNADVGRRFRREARAASMVESDHIVHVFDVGQDPEVGLYMVMEYLTGEDLATRLARETILEVDLAAKIAFQIARALSKAHAAGVVHRDLKPANVFLVARDDGPLHVKVLDFGISKILGQEQLARSGALALTRAGTTLGTPMYASPEQAQGLDNVDHRTDVWSLGVMLYEMLAGRPAYQEKATYEEFIVTLMMQPPDPLATVAPWIPEPLARVVHAAIEHDIEKRIADCDTFARMLVAASPALAAQRAGRMSLVDPGERLPAPKIADDTVQMATPLFDDVLPPSSEVRTVVDEKSPFAPSTPPRPIEAAPIVRPANDPLATTAARGRVDPQSRARLVAMAIALALGLVVVASIAAILLATR